MKTIVRILLFVCLSFRVMPAGAQLNHYHFEAGINAGTLLYQGDLVSSPFGSFKGTRPMVQLWVGKPFTPYLSWRANITIGSLQADESQYSSPSWKQIRNFAFHTPVTELSGVVQYNLYGDNGMTTYHSLTPYVMAGVGLTKLDVHRNWSRLNRALVDGESPTLKGLAIDSMHALPTLLPVLPVGVGLRWMASPKLAVNAEAMLRLTLSDYIDGFSYAANPNAKDSYYGVSIGISFILGEDGGKCPIIRK